MSSWKAREKAFSALFFRLECADQADQMILHLGMCSTKKNAEPYCRCDERSKDVREGLGKGFVIEIISCLINTELHAAVVLLFHDVKKVTSTTKTNEPIEE